MPNRRLTIDDRFVPPVFQGLVRNLPHSQVLREASCDCHEFNPHWQQNDPGHCLPHAFSQGNQRPKWLVISCMDSRFPIELVLGIGAHKICNIRLAGGQLKKFTPDSRAWYSLNLALQHFKTLEGIAIIGHGACGASLDLVRHFSNAKDDQTLSPLEKSIASFYDQSDRNRALDALEISMSQEPDGKYLRHAFKSTSRTAANAATLLGITQTKEFIQSHLNDMGITLPICSMMMSIDPKHQTTPLALLVQQDDQTWENALIGQQPNIQANMENCSRTPDKRARVIPIIPETPVGLARG